MDRKVQVGIDARMIHHSGIGTYLRNLLRELPALKPEGLEFVIFGSAQSLPLMNGFYSVERFDSPIYSAGEQFGFLGRTRTVDVWHSPHYNIPYFCGAKLIATVHDLIPIIFSGTFFSNMQRLYIVTLIKRLLKQARSIVTVSHQTRNDIAEYFKVRPDKIRVIPEGVSQDFRVIEEGQILARVRGRYGLPAGQNFFLYVGLLKPHKNLKVLIDAVRHLRREGKIRQKLLIVGAKDRHYRPDGAYLGGIRSDEDMIYLERVDDSDLALLYNMADIFILPSLYEGFGLPVLEAFACGTPVIVSDRGALPEVAGDAALSFRADSEADLAEAILKLGQDAALRTELRQKGLKRAQEFSWARMARETLEVYKEVAENP